MSEQSLAANTSAAAAPIASSRRRWKQIVASSGLPVEATALITTVIKRARLWQSEAREVAIELVAHFQDGLAAGRTASELTATFGNAKQAARLIRRGKARCRPLWWQAWWWCSRGLLLLLAAYLLLVLWQLWATPQVKINYLEIINQPVLAIPEQDRAWPYYRDAYLQLGLHTYAKDNFKNDPEHLQKLLAESWRPGNKEWPALVAWLERHRPELDKIRQGASKPAYGIQLWIDPSKYSSRDQLALDNEGVLNPAEISQAPLYLMLLSHIDINRVLAPLLCSDSIRAANSGDGDIALANIEAILGLSSQTEETSFLVGVLVALSIDNSAIQTAAQIIYTKPQLWSEAQLQQLAHRLAAQHFHPEIGLQHERYMFLDAVQRTYTDDGHGDGRLALDGLEKMSEIAGLVDRKNNPKSNQNKTLQALTLPTLNLFTASRKELTERYQQLLNQELALLQQPYWQCKAQLEEIEQQFRNSNEKLRYSLSAYLFPAVPAARIALASHQGRQEGLLIGIALELYHREHGSWPDTLEQLSPRYLPKLPVDQLTGKPLIYRLIDGKPCVYSVGQNLKDDGGLLIQPSDNMEYRYGYYDQGFNETDVKEPSDWILWSLVPEHQRSLPLEPEKFDEENKVEAVPAAGG